MPSLHRGPTVRTSRCRRSRRGRATNGARVVVAGAFVAAGSSPWAWDPSRSQWGNPGVGLPSVVRAIEFTGNGSKYLIAAGSFGSGAGNGSGNSNGTQAYAVRRSFDESAWTVLGSPEDALGPAMAVSEDDGGDPVD